MRLLLIIAVFSSVSWPPVARCQGSTPGQVSIEAKAFADSVTVGQRLHISYAATYPDSLTLLPPEQFDTGNCRLVSVKWRDVSKSDARIKQADVVVLPLALESAKLPPLPFAFLLPAGDTLTAFSDAIEVPIRELTTAESQPQPLKPQWEAPRSYLIYILIAGAAVLVVAAIVFWLRRRRRAPVVEVAKPRLPPDFVALKALSEIETMNLPEAGKMKKYYTLVIDVIRHYLEERYAVQTMDRTTDEILYELSSHRRNIEGLEPLLREADLVKFAKFKPELAEAAGVMQASRDFVVRTTPKPVAAVGVE